MSKPTTTYVTCLVWNEKEFWYDEYSGRVDGTPEEIIKANPPPMVIIKSIRKL